MTTPSVASYIGPRGPGSYPESDRLDDFPALAQLLAAFVAGDEVSEFDLGSFLPYQLSVLAGQISREFSRRYTARFGFGRSEWRVLVHLGHAGPASIREIHLGVDMDKSRISRAASRLEEEGLLRKQEHPTDGRLIRLSLTEEGRSVVAELAEMARTYQAELEAQLGPEGASFLRGVAALTEG